MTASQTEFSFGPHPAPQIELFGASADLQVFGLIVGLIILPFALGYLARYNRLASAAAFVAALLTLAAQHALLLHVGGLAPTIIPFPWEHIGQWALGSIPASLAGYFAAAFVFKRRAEFS